MPTYVYEVVKPDGTAEAGSRFEVEQSIKADALAKHPESGKPVRRVIQSISILGGGAATAGSSKPSTSGGTGGRCGPSCGCH
jgi:predicted nucleic acid-binding Zn ribbon protein